MEQRALLVTEPMVAEVRIPPWSFCDLHLSVHPHTYSPISRDKKKSRFMGVSSFGFSGFLCCNFDLF